MVYILLIALIIAGYAWLYIHKRRNAPVPPSREYTTHLVVAGNYNQFKYWAERNFTPEERKHVLYVSNVQKMKGQRNVKVHFIGTYFERADLADIQRETLSLTPFLAK